jgi:outer membrane lipopolysaccharide assembly protein LptE/RlpB
VPDRQPNYLAASRRRPRMKHLSLLVLAACFLLPACAGYQLGAQKPAKLREIRTLAVPTFDNLTLEPRIGVNATNAAIKWIQNHGSYEIVPRDQADAILTATIRNVHRRQFRSDRTNILRTSQMQIILEIQYSIVDASGRTLYTNYVTGDTQMLIDPNLQLSETQALEDAAQRAAINLANDICEGW